MKFVVLFTLSVVLALTAAGQNKVTEISDLGAMAGCWEYNNVKNPAFVSEQWMKPLGSSMIGMGRTVKKGKTTDWEFMRIEQRDDALYFIAHPKANKTETAFKLISSTAREVVFENKEHDFPQRVIYKLGDKTLTGRIEGNFNGKVLAIDFPMVRAKCE